MNQGVAGAKCEPCRSSNALLRSLIMVFSVPADQTVELVPRKAQTGRVTLTLIGAGPIPRAMTGSFATIAERRRRIETARVRVRA